MSEPRDLAAFERIRDHLQQQRGFDFTPYKRASLMRRTSARMRSLRVEGFDAYLDHLQRHPDECERLFHTILVNVTSFFRNRRTWESLRNCVLPHLLHARNGERLRIWSAGCASGEEAYSAAMLLADVLGAANLRDRVEIYATDVDQEALSAARRGVYACSDVEGAVPAGFMDRYFDRHGDVLVIRRDLHEAVTVFSHDLIRDAPIPRIDLLFCRNTLMYFTAEAQDATVARFYEALFPAGFAVLGPTEMIFGPVTSFHAVDLHGRIFRAVGDARSHRRQPKRTWRLPGELAAARES
jgi:Methylase of chemotaxis methyl-accepting proteins